MVGAMSVEGILVFRITGVTELCTVFIYTRFYTAQRATERRLPDVTWTVGDAEIAGLEIDNEVPDSDGPIVTKLPTGDVFFEVSRVNCTFSSPVMPYPANPSVSR